MQAQDGIGFPQRRVLVLFCLGKRTVETKGGDLRKAGAWQVHGKQVETRARSCSSADHLCASDVADLEV